MTFDYFKEYREHVTNLIEKPEQEYVKSPRYRSIHSRRARLELARSKSAHKSLGAVRIFPSDPCDFLRKRTGQQSAPAAVRHVHYRRPGFQHKLPAWKPAKQSRRPAGLPPLPRDPLTERKPCFPRRNVKIARNLRPKPIKPRIVDTRRGDAHELMPNYLYKKNFGRVPENLTRPKFDKSKQDKERSNENSDVKKPLCRYVTEDEREELLKNLKLKWTETMRHFQCLPFIIDSVPKIKRKLRLENKLRQLEKDIRLIESHRYIYVYDD